ncbi:hypothetical protein SAMD00019534_071730, partial [Acytostelium subglobosum LB1]|uniref:hypothetical protein n=1 Tax=Acytostelium subglobosum LB1 TaxID=1410327 RepID=UPI000644AA01
MDPKIIRIGCGAGYQGDRVPPALKLVKEAKLDYLVLECLAERTLTDSIRRMKNGGKGFDPRLKEWLEALLPAASQNNVKIITNMGAADPKGAGEEALDVANALGIDLRIVVVSEVVGDSGELKSISTIVKKSSASSNQPLSKLVAMPSSNGFSVVDSNFNDEENENWEVGCTYLGADALIDALKLDADLVVFLFEWCIIATSRLWPSRPSHAEQPCGPLPGQRQQCLAQPSVYNHRHGSPVRPGAALQHRALKEWRQGRHLQHQFDTIQPS